MDSVRFKTGSYALIHVVDGITRYWRGGFNDLGPCCSPSIRQARIFVSAAHAYHCAREDSRLLDFKARRIGKAGEVFDDHFADRLAARLFQAATGVES